MVADQTSTYLTDNGLCASIQCAYRNLQSTESALLRVSNNILRAVDRHEDVFLVPLDLSAPLTPMIMTFSYMDFSLVLDFVDLFFTGWERTCIAVLNVWRMVTASQTAPL